MDVTKLPFNNFIGLQHSQSDDYLLTLPASENYLNHLNTVHASALFAIAEASSGKFLLNEFNDIDFDIIPVVRKVEVKYSKPAKGTIYSKAKFKSKSKEVFLDELVNKSRTIIEVEVNVFTSDNTKVLTAAFQWFVSKID